ncbi:MAG: LamG-like jellyroll fold domain-containing protein [Victivallales bacterium]
MKIRISIIQFSQASRKLISGLSLLAACGMLLAMAACSVSTTTPPVPQAKGEARWASYAVYAPGLSLPYPSWPSAMDWMRLGVTGKNDASRRLEIAAAREAGLDGFVFYKGSTLARNETALGKSFDEYAELLSAASGTEFKILFMIDCQSGKENEFANVLEMSQKWFARFGTDPNVPRMGGLPMISVYNTDLYLEPEKWKDIFSDLARVGHRGFWIGDFRQFAYKQVKGKFPPDIAKSLRSYVDAGFRGVMECGLTTNQTNGAGIPETVSAYFSAGGTGLDVVSIGPVAEYWRGEYGIYVSPRGTAKFRDQWDAVLQSGANMGYFQSWNDFSENHTLAPTFLRGHIRGDINKHYAARLKGLPPPAHAGERVYLTFRRSVTLGEAIRIEVLRPPSTAGELSVSVELNGADGSESKRVGPFKMTGSDLQAETAVFSGLDFKDERAVSITARITGKDGIERRRHVGFIRMAPGINEDLATVSFLLDEIPEAPSLTMKDNLLRASAPGGSVRLQLLRNDGEIIAESPASSINDESKGEIRVRLLLQLGSVFTSQSPWVLSIEGGRAVYANFRSPSNAKFSIEPDGSVSFYKPGGNNFYKNSLYVDTRITTDDPLFVIRENGKTLISFSFDEIRRKRVLAWQRGTGSCTVSLVGGEPNNGYRGLKGKPEVFAFDISPLPPGSASDVYYARSFTEDGAWVDSVPFVVKNGDCGMVAATCLDEVSGSIVPVRLRKEETLMLSYDFSEKAEDFFLVRDSSMRGAHTVLQSGSFILGAKTGSFLAGQSPFSPTPEKAKDPSRTRMDGRPALSLDGSDAFSIPYCIPEGPFTMDIDLNIPEFDVERTILSDQKYPMEGTFCLRVLGDGRIKASRNDPSQTHGRRWDDLLSSAPLPCGKWTNVSIVYDNKTMRLYIDGQEAGSIPSTPTPAGAKKYRPFWHLFGREIDGSGYAGDKGPSRPFLGKVGGLRIYCVAKASATHER